MSLWEWAINLPRYFAEFGEWLITPLELKIGDWVIGKWDMPIVLFGAGMVGFIVLILALRMKGLFGK